MSVDSPQAAIKLEELKKTKSAKNLIADDRVYNMGLGVEHTKVSHTNMPSTTSRETCQSYETPTLQLYLIGSFGGCMNPLPQMEFSIRISHSVLSGNKTIHERNAPTADTPCFVRQSQLCLSWRYT